MLRNTCRSREQKSIQQGMKSSFKQQIVNELLQKEEVTECLINKILFSKRLLVDHVESLENFKLHTQTSLETKVGSKQTTNNLLRIHGLFSARNTCTLLGGALLGRLSTPRALLPSLILVGGFGAMYLVKNVFILRNRIIERELDSLIHTIDAFGNCMRRSITYFNEVLLMKQQELMESRQIEHAWDRITAAKEATEILYDATRKLEAHYPLPSRFLQFYSPMEELRDCEYFKTNVTDYSPKHIKDFYNIFAYIQSQFLLRFALALSTAPSLGKLSTELVKIDCLLRQLVQEEENHFKNLTKELEKKKRRETESLNSTRAMQNRSGPVAALQDSSLKLSARMVAVASECQALDITLQRLTAAEASHGDNTQQLLEAVSNMRSIESALSICCDDFHRLILVYNKFLNSKLNNANEKDGENTEAAVKDRTEDLLRVEICENSLEREYEDDFYAYIFDEKQDENNTVQKAAIDPDREICHYEKRLTKSKFQPVLKQLKDRIDPIRQEMLEKERKVLAAKGIDVDNFFGEDAKQIQSIRQTDEAVVNAAQISGNESDDSAELEYRNRTKKFKERDNYKEMRNFLAQKPAINLFKLEMSPPAKAVVDEDILE